MSYLVPKWFRQPSSRRVLVTIKFKPFPLLLRFWTGLDPQCFRKLLSTSELLWKIFTLKQIQQLCLSVFFFSWFRLAKIWKSEYFNFQAFKITKIFIFEISKRPNYLFWTILPIHDFIFGQNRTFKMVQFHFSKELFSVYKWVKSRAFFRKFKIIGSL